MGSLSRFEEFKESISERITNNNWEENEPMAFFGYLFALMENGDISLKEYWELYKMLPLNIDESKYKF